LPAYYLQSTDLSCIDNNRVIYPCVVIMLAASSRMHDVTVGHLSVCLVGILTVTHQGAACEVASSYFGPTISRSDILVFVTLLSLSCCCVTVTNF